MRPEEKIYKAYFESKKSRLYFNELKELSGLSDSSLTNTLSNLTKSRMLSQEKTKSNTFYTIKDKKLIAIKFSELAIRQYKDLNHNVRIPLDNFLKELPKTIYIIILFGSASRKEEQKKSDIDLLVVSDKPVNLDANKKNAEVTSHYLISIFQCTIADFQENKDHVVIQARKTGFPIYKEQNFYEVVLDGY